jgi:hypothetical protein
MPVSLFRVFRERREVMAFVTIRNGLYNAVAEGLGQNRDSFALLQPAQPILNQQALWQLFNILPPESLTHNIVLRCALPLGTTPKRGFQSIGDKRHARILVSF